MPGDHLISSAVVTRQPFLNGELQRRSGTIVQLSRGVEKRQGVWLLWAGAVLCCSVMAGRRLQQIAHGSVIVRNAGMLRRTNHNNAGEACFVWRLHVMRDQLTSHLHTHPLDSLDERHHGSGEDCLTCQHKTSPNTAYQKALKTLAARNTAILNRMHMISLGINLLFFVVHFLFSSRSLFAWFILTLPALVIEFWFERIGRPTHANGDLKRSGEDLEAKGLTEWMWDITYWTWFCVVLAALVGNKAWYAWVMVPAYSGYLAFTTFTGARKGLAGMGGGATDGGVAASGPAGQSKRQAKLEKRGGQRMQYR